MFRSYCHQCFFLTFRPCCTINHNALKSFIGISLISWASDGRDLFTCFTSFFFISFIISSYNIPGPLSSVACGLQLVAFFYFRIILKWPSDFDSLVSEERSLDPRSRYQVATFLIGIARHHRDLGSRALVVENIWILVKTRNADWLCLSSAGRPRISSANSIILFLSFQNKTIME